MGLPDRRYLKLRQWVDRDLKNHSSLSSYLIFVPAFVMWLMQGRLSSPWRITGWGVAIGWGAAWGGFVLWRTVRLWRVAMLQGGRIYDERGKYMLPPEYRDTESAGAVRRRKMRARFRKG